MIHIKEITLSISSIIIVGLLVQLLSSQVSALTLLTISILLFVTTTNIILYITKKPILAFLQYALFAAVTYNTTEFGIFGIEKIIAFLLAGIIFEITTYFLELRVHHLFLDILLGTIFSFVIIALSSAFFLSSGGLGTLLISFVNYSLYVVLLALATTLAISLIWSTLQKRKWIIKLQGILGDLN